MLDIGVGSLVGIGMWGTARTGVGVSGSRGVDEGEGELGMGIGSVEQAERRAAAMRERRTREENLINSG